ncbi:Aminomethyltransferase, mitochondrial [Taxawa tesnikishii (nom. ined.)]|nr:Aminomethyltransferase, mitochondrial [Dothideales sp. JES 119]
MSAPLSARQLVHQARRVASRGTVVGTRPFYRALSQTSPASRPGYRTLACRPAALAVTVPGGRYASSSAADQSLDKTGLYDLHLEHGGKMVPFGGYLMPVQYSDLGVGESHKWTREKASLFDVSHMVQYHLSGPGATALLEKLTPSDLTSLPPHQSTLSALLHPETGGICDDTIITRLTPEKFYIVTNAGCREKDYAYLMSNIDAWNNANQPSVKLEQLSGQGLIALQGPLAANILQSVLADPSAVNLKDLYFGSSKFIQLALPHGKTAIVLASRGGYTGEDGFEISIPPEHTVAVTSHLLQTAGSDKLRLAGLGARDSLRLEAGMCLYGHDLDDSTTPVEGGLSWIVAKSRREKGGFNGADVILPQLIPASKGGSPPARRRVGLVVEERPRARAPRSWTTRARAWVR